MSEWEEEGEKREPGNKCAWTAYFLKNTMAPFLAKNRVPNKNFFSLAARRRGRKRICSLRLDNACIIAGPAASFSTRKLEASYADRKG